MKVDIHVFVYKHHIKGTYSKLTLRHILNQAVNINLSNGDNRVWYNPLYDLASKKHVLL
jgi:hypothetical protein